MSTPKHILIVDDEPDLARLLAFNLACAGFETIQALNGRDALQSARTYKPDLVLLDVLLPDISGLDVCRALRADHSLREVPVLLLTAHASPQTRLESLRMGVVDIITKPFSLKDLVPRIRQLLAPCGP